MNELKCRECYQSHCEHCYCSLCVPPKVSMNESQGFQSQVIDNSKNPPTSALVEVNGVSYDISMRSLSALIEKWEEFTVFHENKKKEEGLEYYYLPPQFNEFMAWLATQKEGK